MDAGGSGTYFDVIIVGGGVAGCSTALSLASRNRDASFLVVDDADSNEFKIGESLPPEGKGTIHSLFPSVSTKLGAHIAREVHITCTGTASIWSSHEIQENFAITHPLGEGLHIDRAVFDESLRDSVRELGSQGGTSNRLLKCKFVGVRRDEPHWVVQVVSSEDGKDADRQEYKSLWIIDATGRKASVGQKLGAKTLKLDKLLAFYALFSSSEEDSDRRTFIEATENGWWYTSQLAHQQRVVVFHTDDCDPAAKLARKTQGFLDILRRETRHISPILEAGSYHMVVDGRYPRYTAASTSCLTPFGSEVDRWCAVGDAAMAFDPLSSQGIYTALRCGASVGKAVAEELQSSGSGDGLAPVQDVYTAIWEDYGDKRHYFYSHSMFDGEFWQRRR